MTAPYSREEIEKYRAEVIEWNAAGRPSRWPLSMSEGTIMREIERWLATLDGRHAENDATLITVPHPDIDVQVIATGDVMPEEALEMVAIATHSLTRETIAVPIPKTVRTVDDFFGDAMAQSIAETLWNRSAHVCTVCRTEKMFVNEHGICPDCTNAARAARSAE